MKNREIYQRDPLNTRQLNDGVASVMEAATEQELLTLRYELEHFVCEGQYEDGITRILDSYIGNVSSTTQPAAWISGFFGSGKSHMLKMLRHLWVDTAFADGATARGLARLPQGISDLLRALDTLGKRCGGLHAASGTLPSGGGESVRLAVLSILLRSRGYPESLPQAQFVMWLERNGFLEQVRKAVQKAGRDFRKELHDLYVSPVLAQAILDADPAFAPDLKQARAALRTQFPVVEDLPTGEFVRIAKEVVAAAGQLPCTVIVLDEVQLFIGDSPQRSADVQEVAEALCKQMQSRVLLIGAGQTALAGDVPLLQRLKGRFTIPVELSDADVETVTRRVVLAKRADKRTAVEEILARHSGEIDRQLAGTRIGPRTEDRDILVEDYPLLPARRRFWEHALRAVDLPGTSSQLRTQLRIVYDAVRQTAEGGLGTVVPADFIFGQLQPDLLRTGVLLREIDETIRNLDDGSPDGILARRLCGLIFLIRKLSRDQGADIGVRATEPTLADLLVADLATDGTRLRKDIPRILSRLLEDGKLIKLDNEYTLQTRESSEWEREFRNRVARITGDLTALGTKRSRLLQDACAGALTKVRLLQGQSKDPRKVAVSFGQEPPKPSGTEVPVWVRDGWGEKEAAVLAEARAAGAESPIVFVFVPRSQAEALQKAIIDADAAQQTLDFKGTPSAREGQEAREAMATRRIGAEATRNLLLREVIDGARVFQGGGSECFELDLPAKVQAATEAALDRLFPRFKEADDSRWSTVIGRARNGDEAAFQAIGWTDAATKHPAAAAVLASVGAGKSGKQVREHFEQSPYGWPRDAVDAALMTLFTAGHLRAVHKGAPLTPGQLDQAKVSVTDFRVESQTVDARGRIKLRKLYQAASIACKPNEEAAKASEFLAHLADLAAQAGGDPPLPPRPATSALEELRTLAGNEQLCAILEQHDPLLQNAEEWQRLADLAEQRRPAWDALCRLLRHADGLPAADDSRRQAEAVRQECRLLDPTDPVPDIRKATADLLREAAGQAYEGFRHAYAAGMKQVQALDAWGRLEAAAQVQILARHDLHDIPAPSLATEADLLRSLDGTSLANWSLMTDALQQRFAAAARDAAKLMEPKVQHVHLSSSTLKTPADVKAWLADAEKQIADALKRGPVVVS